MDDVAEFITAYTEADLVRIAFAWNGKHAGEFEDANQEFRGKVVQACLAAPEVAPLLLLEHLFLADAEWSREVWGSSRHFANLAEALLKRGQETAIPSFAKGFLTSFDTFGACHQLHLPAELLDRLLRHTQHLAAEGADAAQRSQLEACGELFAKLRAGNAAAGWVPIEPGTPVTNVRVVWPRWYLRVWMRFRSLWKYGP
ncbi:MAG TPA: hypothetical protein VNA88_06015 [Candidatus Kapabacteria bacterium]|jgi:hypothetical protein|nr:hypothetical protein [Candidatus Kapabacteria bacterium]